MVRTIDRYLIREILPPFLLALLVFTFILMIPPVMEQAEGLIAKGVAAGAIVTILATLLPQALGVTIPMALLVGLLMALGRLSGDRETVALQACGVSIYRLLVPVAVIAVGAWAATSYVLIVAMPEANQTFRELTYDVVATRAERDVKPRVFFEDFPNIVLYVRDVPAGDGGWQDVFLADLRDPTQSVVFTARRGRMILDRPAHRVEVLLEEGALHRAPADDVSRYEVEAFATMRVSLDPDQVFQRAALQRGVNEMSLPMLRAEAAAIEAQGLSAHPQLLALHRKFSIPVACLVFAAIGLGLGVTSRKDRKQASFVIGIAVIFAYYVVMYFGESMAKARMVQPALAAWLPNLVLGLFGAALLVWKSRSAERRVTLPWVPRHHPRPPERVVVSPPGSGGRGDRVVVVIRVPHFWLPRPTLLDGYVARSYLRTCGMAALGMLGIFYIATFIDLSDKLFKGQTTGGMLLAYFWYATPQFIYYVVPISALVSTLVTVSLLTKTSELVVMKACGISLYRVALPLVLFGAMWSLALFALEERVLAAANRQAQAIRHVIRGGSPQTFDVLNRRWMVSRDGKVYHYESYDPDRIRLEGLTIYDLDPRTWDLRQRTFAERARYASGHEPPAPGSGTTWTLTSGWIRRFEAGGDVRGRFRTFETEQAPLEDAGYFTTELPNADRMTYDELKSYIDELRTSGFNVGPYAVALQRKLSFPFVTVIMTLIAVPFAVTIGRRGALFGIGVGIALAIAYWLLFSVFAAIGTAGLLTPVLAAWAANVLFAAAASYLLLTVRT